jgi:predicted porin
MKKLVLASLLAATVGMAQAQSVTLYGVLDAGVTTATNANGSNKSVTGISNGGLSTPRIGFKGTEDLGGGLKANFNLESELLTDTGAQGDTSTLFNRASWVGLEQSGVGTVKLGRFNRLDYSQAAKYDNISNGGNVGSWIASNSGTVSLGVTNRIANAIEVQSASIGGLVLSGQYGFGEVAGATEAGRTISLGAEYTFGSASVAYTHSEVNATTGAYLKTKANSVSASYDAKVVKVSGGYSNTETEGTAGKPSGWYIGATAPVTAKVTVMAQYNHFDNDAGKKPSTYALGATYAFSKRTTGYVIGAHSSQDNGSAQNVVSTSKYANFASPAAGLNQTVASVGIRHTF